MISWELIYLLKSIILNTLLWLHLSNRAIFFSCQTHTKRGIDHDIITRTTPGLNSTPWLLELGHEIFNSNFSYILSLSFLIIFFMPIISQFSSPISVSNTITLFCLNYGRQILQDASKSFICLIIWIFIHNSKNQTQY